MLSTENIILMFILHKIIIETFSNFVNIRGAASKLKQRQRNSRKFPDQRKRTNCPKFFSKATKKYTRLFYKKHFYKKMSLKKSKNLKKMLRKSPASNASAAILKNLIFPRAL